MKYSLIIPTCKSSNFNKCLESIKEYTDLSNIEIIPVPNGYDGENKDYPLWFDERIGYTKAVNEGLKKATGDFIILLNDDTVLLKQNKNEWIEMLSRPFEDESVGITAPLISYCPYAERHFAIFFCVMIRKKLFDEIGLLDTIFNPGGGEDTDFCIKAEQLGYKIVQVPGDHLRQEANFMVGQFPIYHEAENTVNDLNNWSEIIDKNRKILSERYKLPEGWFYEGDIEEYRRLVNEIPNNGILCELGCYKGRSLCSVADIIKRKNIGVIVVDTFEGTVSERKDGELPQDFRQEFEDNVKRFGLQPTIYQMSTDEASQLIGGVDLLFIDADHTYNAVKNDLENWESHVIGTISGHDYNSHIGVNQAVDKRYKDIRVKASIWSKKL